MTEVADVKPKKVKSKQDSDSITIRVNRDTLSILEFTKQAYAEKLGLKKMSHSVFLSHCCKLAQMMLAEQERYFVSLGDDSGRIFDNLPEARGASLQQSVRNKTEEYQPPQIVLFMGYDDALKL